MEQVQYLAVCVLPKYMNALVLVLVVRHFTERSSRVSCCHFRDTPSGVVALVSSGPGDTLKVLCLVLWLMLLSYYAREDLTYGYTSVFT